MQNSIGFANCPACGAYCRTLPYDTTATGSVAYSAVPGARGAPGRVVKLNGLGQCAKCGAKPDDTLTMDDKSGTIDMEC
jgi:hypothetical protein